MIEAEQTEPTARRRATTASSPSPPSRATTASVRSLGQLSAHLLEEIEHFFVSYNEIKGKEFKPLGRFGPERALELVEEGMKRFRQSKNKRKQNRGR